ncbi:MAG: protein-L-isoaspartate(D-aspartate) O-methyltransferase [Phycisphaerales bacterium]|nr:protein-L-isoaspartate(D-aspartate) O-methyltransferase [Phycisphaerales bacterium]
MRQYLDTPLHQGLRKKLVDELRSKGIKDELVLQAILKVPRHLFFDSILDKVAYEDRAFAIGAGQTISQPYTVAFQTQALSVKKNDKILEVGTGSIYQSSILAALGARVFTIERQKLLFDNNKHFCLKHQYPTIKFFYGDGFEGIPAFAPYDKILITAAAPFVPPKLINQLKGGGIMIVPIQNAEDSNQRMTRLTKSITDDTIQEEFLDNFSFVPMLKGTAK